MGIFNNISRFDDDEIDINYILSLLSAQGIHFDQNKNLDMGDKRIMMTIFRTSQVLKDVGIFVGGEMFANASGEVSVDFTNITGTTTCT